MRITVPAAFVSLFLAGSAAASSDFGFERLPLTFHRNAGQTSPSVDFVASGPGYTLFLERTRAVFRLTGGERHAAFSMKVAGAHTTGSVSGVDALPGKSNYFIGNDASKWRTGVDQYAKVRYSDVYAGIDLLYYGNQHQLEYDFIVRPGGDPDAIALDFDGVERISVDTAGDLVLSTPAGEVRQPRPLAYQEIDGTRVAVDASYRLTKSRGIQFAIGSYRKDLPLVIDPVLVYASYLGGSGPDNITRAGVDAAGNIYIAANVSSPDFPTSTTPPGQIRGVYVMKLNPAGDKVLYVTYLGSHLFNRLLQFAVDPAGSAHLVVEATGLGYPTTPNALASSGIRVTKLSPAGDALVFSTGVPGLRGSIYGVSSALGPDGSFYIADMDASTFVPSAGAYQTVNAGVQDVLVVRLKNDGTSLLYSTLIGGSGEDYPQAIAVDAAGNAYIAGVTKSINFPVTPGSMQAPMRDVGVAFAAKLNPNGTALAYSTLLPSLRPAGGAVNVAGEFILASHNVSTQLYTPTVGAYSAEPAPRPGFEGVLSKLNAAGNGFAFSAIVGEYGPNPEIPIATDSAGNIYVAACTKAPVTADAFQPHFGGPGGITGGSEGCLHVSKWNPSGSALLWGTYYTGTGELGYAPNRAYSLVLDPGNNVYIAGLSAGNNLPTTAGALKPKSSGFDAFIAKISNAPSNCSYSLGETNVIVPPSGGFASFPVTAPAGCIWTSYAALGSHFYTHMLPESTGIGSGTAKLRIDPNDFQAARIANAFVAGQAVIVQQAAPVCDLVLQNQIAVLSNATQQGTIHFSSPPGCFARVSSNVPWITLPSNSASGSSVTYSVVQNFGTRRTGSVRVAGHTFTVIQNGSAAETGCSYAVSAVAQTPGITRDVISGTISNSFSLFTQSGCPWTVAATAPWIHVTTPLSGAGPAPIVYTLDGNPGTARTASITVGGQTVLVSQPGSSCSVVTGNWSTTEIPASGGTGSFEVTPEGPLCNWSAASNKSWAEVYPLTGRGYGNVTYTIYPNFSTARRYAVFTIEGRSHVLTQAAATGTANERFVGQMYFNFFGRRASPQEIAFHVASLASISRADLVMNFMNSAEFNNGGRFIAGLYVGLLNRNAEYSGWLFQRNALSTAIVNPFQLVENFVGSDEWKLKFGTPTDSEYVRLLYRYILLREPNQSEINVQVGALAGGVTRIQLAAAFLNTPEFRQGTGPRLTAFLLYALLLLRDPAPSEMDARIAQIASNAPLKSLVQEIIGAGEFATLLQ